MSTVDFVLQRSPGSEAEELGLRLYFQPPAPDVAGICLVNGISESGLVAKRNSECAAGQQLQVGDELLLVNGRSEQGELSKELHSALFLQIRARHRAAKTEPLRTQSRRGGRARSNRARGGRGARRRRGRPLPRRHSLPGQWRARARLPRVARGGRPRGGAGEDAAAGQRRESVPGVRLRQALRPGGRLHWGLASQRRARAAVRQRPGVPPLGAWIALVRSLLLTPLWSWSWSWPWSWPSQVTQVTTPFDL